MKLSQFLTKAVFALEAAFFISHSGLLLVPLQFLPRAFYDSALRLISDRKPD